MLTCIQQQKKQRLLQKNANAKRLIITHISSRYDKETSEQLVNEAREIFPETEIASDLATFEI